MASIHFTKYSETRVRELLTGYMELLVLVTAEPGLGGRKGRVWRQLR